MKNLPEEIRKTLDACNGKTYESVAIEFQTLFLQAIEEVVGEKEKDPRDGKCGAWRVVGPTPEERAREARNTLRAEQRERAKKLISNRKRRR